MVVAWRVKREVHQLLVDRNDACRNRAEHAASAGNRSQTPAGFMFSLRRSAYQGARAIEKASTARISFEAGWASNQVASIGSRVIMP